MFAVAAAAALMLESSGNVAVDWVLKVFTGFVALLIIESQRNLRAYKSVRFRKRLLRVSISLGASAVGILGVAFYLTISFQVAKVFVDAQLAEAFSASSGSPIAIVIFMLIVFFAVGRALFVSFQNLQLSELFFNLPQKELRKLLINRHAPMTPFPLFALFEFSAVLFAYLYVSMATSIFTTIRAIGLL